MPRRISSGIVGRSILGDIFTQDNTVQSVVENTNIVLQPSGSGIVESQSSIQINDQNTVRFGDSDSSNFVSMRAPGTISSNYTLTLPVDNGTDTQILSTDGTGALSWVNAGLVVTNRSAADSNTYYIAMSDQTSGTETELSVADGRLEFIPNPGRLSTNQLRVTASTSSSSTSTGALVVTGGVGIGGQLTAVDIVETSSIALKENIEPIENGLSSILALKGVTYNRKADENKDIESGLIAEWTEEVLPDLVTRDTDGNVVGIKYTKLTAYLIEAVKSLKLEIDELKNK